VSGVVSFIMGRVRAESGDNLRRASAIAAPVAVCIAIAVVVGHPMGDWEIAREGGDLLLGGHLDVYAIMPTAQMGPLALLLGGGLPGELYLATACLLFPVLLLLIMTGQPMTRRLHLLMASGGMLLAWPWVAFGVQGHLDEALVTLGAVGMVVAYEQRRDTWLWIAFLVAIAAKPTVVVLLPLVFMRSRRAGLYALIGTGLIWAPFFLADPAGFIAAGRGPGDIWPGSLHALLGAEPHSGFPAWVRPVQLVGGMTLVWALARYRSAAAAVVGVFALRALLEPGAWNYYGAAIAAVALLFDARNLRWPAVTALGAVAFASVVSTPVSPIGGHLRLAAIALVLVVIFVFPSSTHRRRLDEPGVSTESQPFAEVTDGH
jgi:hypothetical protein